MRRWLRPLSMLLVCAALLLPVAVPAQPLSLPFWIGVVDETGEPITSGVTCHVYTTSSINTAATVYSNVTLATAITQPITGDSRGICAWFSPVATTTYDVIVYYSRGISRLQAVTVYDHKVVVDRQAPYKHARFAFSNTLTQEVSSGILLPKGAMVEDVVVEVVTNYTNATVSVGLLSTESSGTVTGFVSSQAASVAGFFRPGATWTVTQVGDLTNVYLSANTRGTLLADAAVGVAANGSKGYYIPKRHLISGTGARTISYSTSSSAVAGFIHVFYTEIGNR